MAILDFIVHAAPDGETALGGVHIAPWAKRGPTWAANGNGPVLPHSPTSAHPVAPYIAPSTAGDGVPKPPGDDVGKEVDKDNTSGLENTILKEPPVVQGKPERKRKRKATPKDIPRFKKDIHTEVHSAVHIRQKETAKAEYHAWVEQCKQRQEWIAAKRAEWKQRVAKRKEIIGQLDAYVEEARKEAQNAAEFPAPPRPGKDA